MTRLIFYILSLGDPWCRVNLWVSFFLITTCTCTLFWNTVLFSNPGVMANFVVASWCRKWIRSGMAWWSLGWHGCDGYSLTRVFIRYYVWKKSKAKLKLCHQVYAFFSCVSLTRFNPRTSKLFHGVSKHLRSSMRNPVLQTMLSKWFHTPRPVLFCYPLVKQDSV